MENRPTDWRRFKKRIYLKADPLHVYNCWTKPVLIKKWFLEQASFHKPDGSKRDENQNAVVGDSYKWKWHQTDSILKGFVKETNGKDLFSFTFDQCIVDIRISQERSMTHCTITQYEIPTDENSRYHLYVGCSLGWSFWLVNLKAWLEHGILLDDRSPGVDNLMEVVNV